MLPLSSSLTFLIRIDSRDFISRGLLLSKSQPNSFLYSNVSLGLRCLEPILPYFFSGALDGWPCQ